MDPKPNAKIIQMSTQKTRSGSSPTSNHKRKQEVSVPDEHKPPPKHFKAESPPSSNKDNAWLSSSDEEESDRMPRTVPYISRFFKEEVPHGTYPYIMRLFREPNAADSSSELVTDLKRMYPNFSRALSHEDIKNILGASVASSLECTLKRATLARLQWKARETEAIADIMGRFVSFFEFVETRSLNEPK